jgi:hypothetical protein
MDAARVTGYIILWTGKPKSPAAYICQDWVYVTSVKDVILIKSCSLATSQDSKGKVYPVLN